MAEQPGVVIGFSPGDYEVYPSFAEFYKAITGMHNSLINRA